MADDSSDGVRIVREPGSRGLMLGLIVAAFVVAALMVTSFMQQQVPPTRNTLTDQQAQGASIADVDSHAPATAASTAATPSPPTPKLQSRVASAVSEAPAEWRTGDANDLATYFSPGDPVPTGRELIQALRASGETEGIAAFNPPGTMPLMVGIAVPPDYALPPGYVRHHQVTDDGEPLEAILMYAPDALLRDAAGDPIPIPEDRIVPLDMAPPGLPIRQISLPPSG